LLALAIAAAAMLFTERLIRYDLLSRIAAVEATLSGSGPAELRLYYQRPPATRSFTNKRMVKQAITLGRDKQRITTNLQDELAVLLLIDIETRGQPVFLNSLIFKNHYAPAVKLTQKDLLTFFKPDGDTTLTKSGQSGVKLDSTTQPVSLVSVRKIEFSNGFLQHGLSALVGVLIFFLVQRFDASRIPALAQLSANNDGAKTHSYELDGLRGLAALFVVADHTWGLFSGSGVVGVWIFFALSGYLLAIPFIRRPEMVFRGNQLLRYFFRRLARIIPMYYTAIFIYYLAAGNVKWAVPHLLFVEGDGHLWTIPQEMLFYLLLPLVMIGMALLIRVRFIVALSVLLALTLWLLWHVNDIPIHINGRPGSRPPFIGWFLAGICVSYILNHDVPMARLGRFQDSLKKPLGMAALLLLAGGFVMGSVTLSSEWAGNRMHPGFDFKSYYGLAAAFLVFAAVYARDSVYGAVLRFKPLRSFGIIGFSAYLMHPLLLELIKKTTTFYLGFPLAGFLLFATTTLLTWFVAVFTFSLIEHPFLARQPETLRERMASADALLTQSRTNTGLERA